MLCICSFLMLAGLASREDSVPPGYPSGSGETGGDTPLSSARRTRPRRGGAGSGVKVRYTPRLLRGILRGLLRQACPACSGTAGMRQEIAHTSCARRPGGTRKARLWACLSLSIKLFYPVFPLSRGSAHEIDFAVQNHKNREHVSRFLYL